MGAGSDLRCRGALRLNGGPQNLHIIGYEAGTQTLGVGDSGTLEEEEEEEGEGMGKGMEYGCWSVTS